MKTQYINNIPFLAGELTLVKSDHAEATLRHSAFISHSFSTSGLNVLTINCAMSDRRFRSYYYDTYGDAAGDTRPTVVLKSSVNGNLIGERKRIDRICREETIGVLILAGWEFASSTQERQDRLYGYLTQLMTQGMIVIIYAHTWDDPEEGEQMEFGEHLARTYEVKIDSSNILDKIVKMPPVIAMKSDHEMVTAGEVCTATIHINQ